jgi:RHS repeat-associated protein
VTSETAPKVDFRFGYTGRERDEETGLDYYRARYYDPSNGRFISEDPIGFGGGDANLSRYVLNSPTNFNDPSGHSFEDVINGGINKLDNFLGDRGVDLYGAVNTADQGLGGFGSGATGGLTDLARQGIYGGNVNANQQGLLHDGASLLGDLASSAVGGAAAKGGSWLVRAGAGLLNNANKAADIYGKAQSAYDIARGCGTPEDLMNLAGGIGNGPKKRGGGHNGHPPVSALGPEHSPNKSLSPKCFAAGTSILTTTGKKAIEELRLGDWVLSWDEETGEVIERPVTELFQRETSAIIDIFIGIEKISCTTDHPFWVQGQGWVLAFQLKSGSVLRNREGQTLVVDVVRRRDEVTQVYNVEIDGLHTYFVSNLEILSHNMCGDVDDLSKAGQAIDQKSPNFTKAGRSLTKHGQGSRIGNSKFPAAKGNQSKINQTAQDQLDDILTDPGTTINEGYRGRFGKTTEVNAPDGRGAVFGESGEFLFFKEN